MNPESPRYLYHPPVQHSRWTLKTRLSLQDLAEMATSQLKMTEADWERILWHGGLYLEGKRLGFEKLPPVFPAGKTLDVYYFTREPKPIPVSEDNILMREKGWLAANKPPWLPVQGSRVSLRFGFEEALRALPGLKNLTAVHRLDRETSGVVLLANEKPVEAWLMKQFHDQQVSKSYLAVVSPPPAQDRWKVEGSMVRDFHRLPQDFYRLRPGPEKNGKWSETEFEALKVEGERGLVLARPKTGRTHQIRVHLAHAGHPIVGDRIYGRKDSPASRLQLHAFELEFNIKEGKLLERKRVKAPIPEDFLIKT